MTGIWPVHQLLYVPVVRVCGEIKTQADGKHRFELPVVCSGGIPQQLSWFLRCGDQGIGVVEPEVTWMING